MCGAVSAMFVDSVDAKSSGKLCAFLSCITSIPKFALFRTSPHVGTIFPLASTTDWLKLKPFKLNAIVHIPMDVNHTHTTGNTAKKKCRERELLNEAYWKINLPKYPCAATILYLSLIHI